MDFNSFGLVGNERISPLSGEGARRAGEGKMFAEQTETDLTSYRPNVLATSNDSAIADRATLVRNDEKQQTETNLSDKRSFASLKMTNNSHSEQREESYKLDCFARPADGGNGARNDGNEVFPRPLRERVRVRGNNLAIADRASLVRNDGKQQTETNLFTYLPIHLFTSKKAAFTLAEVLITLGIIGVVAAITMPTIMANVQKTILKNQFKSAYSKFSQALLQTQQNMGYPVECFSWIDGQRCKEVCTERNKYGTCIRFKCADGSSLPGDQNGHFSDCSVFYNELFTKTLKTAKYCEDNALANGCLTDAYRGMDKAKAELYPDTEQDPNGYLSDNMLKNLLPVWVLADGTIFIKRDPITTDTTTYFAFDVNGHKGPNKWGYDIFQFLIVGDTDGIKGIQGINSFTEKGGTASTVMFRDAFAK